MGNGVSRHEEKAEDGVGKTATNTTTVKILGGWSSGDASHQADSHPGVTLSGYFSELSGRSWGSWRSTTRSEGGDDKSVGYQSVQGNLMRSHRKRDPMRYYEVVHILGEGSMGSVAKVRKRDRAKGGSARQAFVKEEHKGDCCFHIKNWLAWLPSWSGNAWMVPARTTTTTTKTNTTSTSGGDNDDELTPLKGSEESKHAARSSSNSNSNSYGKNMDSSFHSFASWSEWVDPKGRHRHNSSKPVNRKEFIHSHSSSLITFGTKKESYYALKSIHLDRCTSKEFVKELKNEVNILKELDHPNIVKAHETFAYHERLFLVLELCNGGDLYTRDPYNELDAARVVRSLLSAVTYLHEHDIVHRDLKFENIMFSDKGPDADIKVIDFGLSQKFARNEHLRDAVGTVYTMSPELLTGEYTAKIDVWSVGVIAFMLLSSSMPFYGRDRAHVIRKIIAGHYSFASRRWKQVSNEAKDFVRELLQLDPELRPCAEEAMHHEWLYVEPSESTEAGNDLMDNIQANIQAFAEYSKLKRLALMVIAYKSTDEEIGILKRMFCRFDRQQHGEITLAEFRETLSGYYSYTDEELEHMFRGIDIDGTGKVHYTEFLAATLESSGAIDEERLAEAFDRIDADCTGYITVSDLQDFLGPDIPKEYLDEIIDECDITRDHRISYEEFLELWNGESDQQLKEAKVSVNRKRLDSRQNSFDSKYASSFVSSVSSVDDFTDSERDFGGSTAVVAPKKDKQEVPFVCGTLSFQKQKRELSVRDL